MIQHSVPERWIVRETDDSFITLKYLWSDGHPTILFKADLSFNLSERLIFYSKVLSADSQGSTSSTAKQFNGLYCVVLEMEEKNNIYLFSNCVCLSRNSLSLSLLKTTLIIQGFIYAGLQNWEYVLGLNTFPLPLLPHTGWSMKILAYIRPELWFPGLLIDTKYGTVPVYNYKHAVFTDLMGNSSTI